MDWKLDRSKFVVGVDDSSVLVQRPCLPATEEQIADYERKIGKPLPPDYREFLSSTNGGCYDPNVEPYVYFDVKQPYAGSAECADSCPEFRYLFTLDSSASVELGSKDLFDLSINFDWYLTSDDEYPHRSLDFVPIGIHSGDNLLVMGIRGEHKGKVASYERMEWRAEAPLEDVFHVANSFDEFLDSVYPILLYAY